QGATVHGKGRPELRLADTVSFRHLGGFAVLVDHRSGRILRLSAAAGRLLHTLESGSLPVLDGEDRAFLEQLAARGLLAGATPVAERKYPTGGAATGGILDRINADAAAARIPLHAQLEVTFRCPLSCRHCYLPPGASRAGTELSVEEIGQLLDQLSALGGLFLLLTGGEPFARPDLRRIFDAARDRRFAVSLLTSGRGADPALLDHMAARGLDAIQVSLHGPDAATHDGFTGAAGSFDAALWCMRRCRALGIRTRAGLTVTRANIDSLAATKALLDRESIPAALGLHLEPRRDGDRAPTSLAVDEAGVRRALALFPPSSATRMAGLGPDDTPCRAGSSVLAIDPFGTVYPCLSLRIPAGNAREEALAGIWSGSSVLERLRGLRVLDLEDCPTCEHRSHCDRCAGFAVGEGGSIRGHTAFDCLQARARQALELRTP
ncbi:MAG TPA: radical SAM protein, partial [Polyangia bacterium]|nr:radical SAM protein [Polyangia bacterium]